MKFRLAEAPLKATEDTCELSVFFFLLRLVENGKIYYEYIYFFSQNEKKNKDETCAITFLYYIKTSGHLLNN